MTVVREVNKETLSEEQANPSGERPGKDWLDSHESSEQEVSSVCWMPTRRTWRSQKRLCTGQFIQLAKKVAATTQTVYFRNTNKSYCTM